MRPQCVRCPRPAVIRLSHRWHGATTGKLINQKLRMLQAAKPCPLTKAVIRDAPLQVVQFVYPASSSSSLHFQPSDFLTMLCMTLRVSMPNYCVISSISIKTDCFIASSSLQLVVARAERPSRWLSGTSSGMMHLSSPSSITAAASRTQTLSTRDRRPTDRMTRCS